MSDINKLNDEEIKKMNDNKIENKKAFSKFVLVMICAGLIGFASGFVSHGIMRNQELFGENGRLFGQIFLDLQEKVAPYMSIINVVLVIVSLATCNRYYKKAINVWENAEDKDEVLDIVDKSLSKGMFISSLICVISMLAFVIGLYRINANKDVHPVLCIGGMVIYFLLMFYHLGYQKKIVDYLKLIYPEKNGSVYDLKFNDKWYDSSDEYERKRMGCAAYYCYKKLLVLCTLLLIISAVVGMILPVSFLFSLAIGIVYIAIIVLYYIGESRVDV